MSEENTQEQESLQEQEDIQGQETTQEGILEITRLNEESFKTTGRRLMMEGIPVSPETYPYLVSGMAKRMLWVRQPREFLSAAFRYGESLEEIYPSIVESIEKEGLKKEWENVCPLTPEGIGKAVSHLRYYGIKPAEIFLSSDGDPLLEEDYVSEEGTTNRVFYVKWLPPGYGIVVPENKSFFGSAISLSEGCFAIVIHNPSRGMVVLKDNYEEEEVSPTPRERRSKDR